MAQSQVEQGEGSYRTAKAALKTLKSTQNFHILTNNFSIIVVLLAACNKKFNFK